MVLGGRGSVKTDPSKSERPGLNESPTSTLHPRLCEPAGQAAPLARVLSCSVRTTTAPTPPGLWRINSLRRST